MTSKLVQPIGLSTSSRQPASREKGGVVVGSGRGISLVVW